MKRQLEDHLRKPNTSPNAESSMSCLSCATPPANDWFSEKPTVHSRSNQQRAAYHQSRNWCATEQLLPATHATHPLDSPLTVPVNNATQATGLHFQYGVGANGWDLEGSPGEGHQVLLLTIFLHSTASQWIFSLWDDSLWSLQTVVPQITLIFPFSDARIKLQQGTFTTTTCIIALSCCYVIDWQISYQCEQATEKVPHKMAGEFILTSSVGALVTWCLDLCFMGLRWGQVWRLHYYKTKPQQMILWQ